QLAHEPVVVGVRDLGRVEDVIAVVVVLDLGAQLVDAAFRLRQLGLPGIVHAQGVPRGKSNDDRVGRDQIRSRAARRRRPARTGESSAGTPSAANGSPMTSGCAGCARGSPPPPSASPARACAPAAVAGSPRAAVPTRTCLANKGAARP